MKIENDQATMAAHNLKQMDRAEARGYQVPPPQIPTCKMVSAASIKPENLKWLWQDKIPAGKLTLLGGKPGLGKSFLTVDMAARISNGKAWPDGSPCKQGSVILCNIEDGAADTTVPRLIDAGAKLEKIHFVEVVTGGPKNEGERLLNISRDVDAIEAMIQKIGDVRLIVFDPINGFIGSDTNSYKDEDVRAALNPLVRIAEQYQVSVLMIKHMKKGKTDDPLDQVAGSGAWVALSRMCWHLVKCPENPERRLLLPAKCNVIKDPKGLAFQIVNGALEYDQAEVVHTLDDVHHFTEAGSEDRDSVQGAVEFLLVELVGGPLSTKELQDRAKAEGIAWRTVERAKKKAMVRSFKGVHGWRMELITDKSTPPPETV